MLSLLPSALVLGTIALLALFLQLSRPIVIGKDELIANIGKIYPFAIMLQALHFIEETVTGFPQQFPALFNLDPIPQLLFLGINVAWIGIWAVTVPGIKSRNAIAFFAAWFLALAGMANLLAHPALALYVGGYFPGLFSAFFVGAACVFLWVRLEAATRS
ncbi:MAG: HXXEE domain-containing protein [Gammaproteobacteria bacterium]